MEVTNLTKKRIEELIARNKRLDGRSLLEFRKIFVEKGVTKKAEGSARVRIGNTEVIAGVKLNLTEPFQDTPDEGALAVNVEFFPIGSEKFEPGPPSVEAIELARIIDRIIRESHFINLKKLCIKKGELAWMVFIDVYPINDDGNLIDASIMASIAALKDAVFPAREEDKVKYGELTKQRLPLNDSVIGLTLYKLGQKFIFDPTTIEEEISQARITVGMSYRKKEFIHAIQKGGEIPLSEEEIKEAIKIIIKKGKEILNKINL